MTTLLLDNFAGPAGPLAGTTPPIPGGVSWQLDTAGLSLTGAGFVEPDDSTTGATCELALAGFVTTAAGGFVAEFDLDMGTLFVGTTTIFFGGFVNLSVAWNSPADWAVNLSDNIGGASAFPSNAPGLHTWQLVYDGVGMLTVNLDGVPLMTLASVWDTGAASNITLIMDAGSATVDMKLGRLVITT